MWAIIGGSWASARAWDSVATSALFAVRVSQGDVSGWLFGIGMVGGACTSA